MEINKAELHLIYKEIKTHPEGWDQAHWARDWDKLTSSWLPTVTRSRCGTAYCFAGHAVARAGYQMNWSQYGDATTAEGDDGQLVHISELARRILGIDGGEACALFDPSNTLEDIRHQITVLTGSDPEE